MKTIAQLIKEIDTHNIYAEMSSLIQQVPLNGEIPVNMASVLQTQCWLITAKITKLISDLEAYAGEVKRNRDDTLADQKALSDEKSESGKERVAKCTPEYRALADEAVIAEVTLNKVLNQKKFFDNGVYVMRSRQEKEARDWQSTPTSEVK